MIANFDLAKRGGIAGDTKRINRAARNSGTQQFRGSCAINAAPAQWNLAGSAVEIRPHPQKWRPDLPGHRISIPIDKALKK